MPNLRNTKASIFGDRAPLIILLLAKEPFATLATSLVVAKRIVVVKRSTFSTNHAGEPCMDVSGVEWLGWK